MTERSGLRNAVMFGLAAALLACGMAIGTSRATAGQPPEVAAGKKQFIRCIACHSVSANGPARTGPHLAGIVGRKVASVPGFKYTAPLSAQEFAWDEARLNHWLEHPQEDFPGMCLPFKGFARPEDRAAIIAYLTGPGA